MNRLSLLSRFQRLGHVLIVPNDHHEQLASVPADVVSKMMTLAQALQRTLSEAGIKHEGANIFLSDGEVAGQEIPHAHLHVAPRFQGDGHRMGFSQSDPDAPERVELDRIAEKIRTMIGHDTYSIKSMPTEEFRSFFQEYAPKIFDENELILRPYQVLDADEKEKLEHLRRGFMDPYRINLGVFKGQEFVGWSWGYQDTADSFYMVNSAIRPEHRMKGLYSRLLDEMLGRLTEMGFQRIYSRHSQTNNAILIPKLKRGFQITSFELSDVFGALVHLTYFTNPTRRKVLGFRAGHLRPDDELRNLFKI